jgi:hypothetical protein
MQKKVLQKTEVFAKLFIYKRLNGRLFAGKYKIVIFEEP